MPNAPQHQQATHPLAPHVDDDRRGGVLTEDRRIAPRTTKGLTAHVFGFGSATEQSGALPCPVADISEGGLFLRVPKETSVTVGQRCEVILAAPAGRENSPDCLGEPIFATVVRTAPFSQGASQFIGAGLRFDQPIYL